MWMRINPETTSLWGSPEASDVGRYSFTLVAEDEMGNSREVAVVGLVAISTSDLAWMSNPISLTQGLEDQPYRVDLTRYVINGDGNPIQFKKVSGPKWLMVSSEGFFIRSSWAR